MRLVTPVDYTGLPYCFAPHENIPPPVQQGMPNTELHADWNHMFPKYEVQTSTSPALQDEISRMALQGCRVQWTLFDQHHGIYNPWFLGPPQPQNDAQLFQTVIMATAGYIPEGAIDFSHNQPQITTLTKEERMFLWQSGQVRVYDPVAVRKFMFRYVLQEDVDHIHESALDEFLHTVNPEKRVHLAHCIAAKIVERAVEPVADAYTLAHGSELLRPGLPKHPRDYVKTRMIASNRRFGRLLTALASRLGEYNRGNQDIRLA